MTGLRGINGGLHPAGAQAPTAAPAAGPPSAGGERPRCDCGVLPHRCWCEAKAAYDRDYNAHVEAAARRRGLT